MYRQSWIEKTPTGIPGFDLISYGGLPKGRTTLVSGTAGSAKTVLATQFLIEGVRRFDEPAVFVTFEESPEDIRKNMRSFGWHIAELEAAQKWVFVDASPHFEEDMIEAGEYDFNALLARIDYAVISIGARRISVDSIGAIFGQFVNTDLVRRELFRLASAIKKVNATALLTTERSAEYGEIARYGVEEFVSDNVILLRNVLEDEKRRRTLEILKFRGTNHQKGEFPFTIMPDTGIVVVPISDSELTQRSSNVRLPSGNDELDTMCGGGFFRDSIILVSGATGTGKTLMMTGFMAAAAQEEKGKGLLFAFEESREQLTRNAAGWGIDFDQMERDGTLTIVCEYPEMMSLEDRLIVMKQMIEDIKPTRVAIDSLSALERVATQRSFREFIIGLTAFVKKQEIAGLFTATTPTLLGGSSATEGHISTLTDSIILLRYVEIHGEMRRGMCVLKMRGSQHDKDIREFNIDGNGMHIGKPFRNVSGILAGRPVHVDVNEIDRLGEMF